MRHINFLKLAIIPISTLNMFNTLRAIKDFPLKPQNKDIIFVYQKKNKNNEPNY